MHCSIVIRAFNEEKHLPRLLEGIRQQTIQDVQIILVDSGSTDSTVEIAQHSGADIVSIDPQEFSFGRSLNRGIQAAAADLVVIVSAHCYPVYPDWLEQLLKPFQDENVALSYGKQRAGSTNWFSEQQFFRKYFPEVSQPNQGQPFSHNANSAIRRRLWEQHPFDEFLTGLEDLSWSSWAMSRGFSLAYSAEAEVIHTHDERPRHVYDRYKREAIAMKQILPESRFSLWNFFRLWSGSVFSDLNQARRERLLVKHAWSILWFRFMQYWGTYRGYAFSGRLDAKLRQTFYYPVGSLADKKPAPRRVQPIDYEKNG